MEMTEMQIASEYRTGKDKTKSIKVLAELNLVPQRRIAEILQAQGEELPKHWKEKLAQPLKRPPKEAALTPAELGAALAAEIPLTLDDLRQDPALPPPLVPAPAALSLDEIRQAALELILTHSPGEAVRFQGYALGVAALADALREKLEGRT